MTSLKIVFKEPDFNSQAYFWTERWQAGEREAEEDLRVGRFEDFQSIDDLVASLTTDVETASLLSQGIKAKNDPQ